MFVAQVGEPRIMLDSRSGSCKAQGVLGLGAVSQAVRLLDFALAFALLLPLAFVDLSTLPASLISFGAMIGKTHTSRDLGFWTGHCLDYIPRQSGLRESCQFEPHGNLTGLASQIFTFPRAGRLERV